jgi:hypothetical protein
MQSAGIPIEFFVGGKAKMTYFAGGKDLFTQIILLLSLSELQRAQGETSQKLPNFLGIGSR